MNAKTAIFLHSSWQKPMFLHNIWKNVQIVAIFGLFWGCNELVLV